MGQDEGRELRWQQPMHWAEYPRDDEISLLDLWLVLRRRWKTLAAVAVAALAVGLAYIVLSPARYRYYETVQVGQVPRETRLGIEDKPIAPVDDVIARVANSLIPGALGHAFSGDKAELRNRYDLKVSSPGDSSVIVISGTGPMPQRDTYFNLLNAVASMLTNEHAAVSDAVRSAYQARLQKARIKLRALNDPDLFRVKLATQQRKIQSASNQLAQVKDQEGMLKLQSQRLDVKEKLLKSQIGRVQQNIDVATRSQVAAAHEAGSAADAMTMLLLGNDVQRSRERLADLRTQLQVELPNERSRLDKALNDNRRQQARQKSLIELRTQELQKLRIEHDNARATQAQTVRELEAQVARVHPTQVVLAPVRSSSSVGVGPRVVLALSLVLGLMLGVLAAFGHEFLVRARVYEEETAQAAAEPAGDRAPVAA